MGSHKYKAFISYSHKDDRWGRWLHRRLENYPLPKNIVGNVTKTGPIPKRLTPIFRDREELAAADSLGEKIEQALSQSENLIMICSPAAARSHWVNQEVLYFKRHNRGAQIFSVIVEGEPFASNMPGREDEECFPPALRYQLDANGELSNIPAEPLAADVRDHADGKRLGVLKLVSGMIGVGLDEVVQRDMKRTRKRVIAITTGALATMLAMGTLTGFALDARVEAEEGRNDAEESIEFMLTDLKPELEKVGRLEALKVVGKRAENYYDKYRITKHGDEALGRRSRVFHFLGEVLNKQGEFAEAETYFNEAYQATKELLDRSPSNANRIYEHAQSAYWRGHSLWRTEKYDQARFFFDEYIKCSERLSEVEPNSIRSLQEISYAYTNLGVILLNQGKFLEANKIFINALPAYESLALRHPDESKYALDLANAYAWTADNSVKRGDLEEALHYRNLQYETLVNVTVFSKSDTNIQEKRLAALAGLARTEFMSGNIKKANELATVGITESLNLWQTDESNLRWLENYALFCLLGAEVANAQDDYTLKSTLIKKYDILKDKSLNVSTSPKFFQRHEMRRKYLELNNQLNGE